MYVARPVPQFCPTSAPFRQVNTENCAVKLAVVGPLSTVSTSAAPSPLKSPTRSEQVEQAPVGFTDTGWVWKDLPVDRRAVTSPVFSSLTMSVRPSPLTSALAVGADAGVPPHPFSGANVPSALPRPMT